LQRPDGSTAQCAPRLWLVSQHCQYPDYERVMFDDWWTREFPIEALTRSLPGWTEENSIKPVRRASVPAEIRIVHFQNTRAVPLRQPARRYSTKFSYLSADATASPEILA
jgi:hypothetical protein